MCCDFTTQICKSYVNIFLLRLKKIQKLHRSCLRRCNPSRFIRLKGVVVVLLIVLLVTFFSKRLWQIGTHKKKDEDVGADSKFNATRKTTNAKIKRNKYATRSQQIMGIVGRSCKHCWGNHGAAAVRPSITERHVATTAPSDGGAAAQTNCRYCWLTIRLQLLVQIISATTQEAGCSTQLKATLACFGFFFSFFFLSFSPPLPASPTIHLPLLLPLSLLQSSASSLTNI